VSSSQPASASQGFTRDGSTRNGAVFMRAA
jgi:hypothetical protein